MPTGPVELVRNYLVESKERRLEEASARLDPSVVFIFPQGTFDALEEMAASLANRYRSIDKTHHTWDVFESGPETVVLTTGTLSGVNLTGVAFEGIRFCDRFVIRHELIVEQQVWNDLAESGVLSRES